MEINNLDEEVKIQLTKLISSRLCPPVSGQAAMDVVVNPPKPGDESYELFMEEKSAVLQKLKNKAKLVVDTFNAIDGVSCQTVQGAMYAFPQISLPEKFINEAKSKGETPDSYYCSLLLEETGICVVPGSGFRQKEGTYHFRTTILPPTETMEKFSKLFTKFHTSLTAKYA
jgi:alanine transaminase